MGESIALWASGLAIGFAWVPFKIYEYFFPERLKRRDRFQERIAVLLGSPFMLLLLWGAFGEKILSKHEGYQFFIGATIGLCAWFVIVLVQLRVRTH